MSRFAVCSFVVLLLVAGCTTSTPPAPAELDLTDTGDTAVLRTGAVTFFSPGDGLVGVTLDESPADGRVDRVYLLQGVDDIPADLPRPLDDARLVDHQRSVIVGGGAGPVRVMTLEEMAMDITLDVREDGATCPRQILGELAGDGEVVSWVGVGLAQRVVSPDGAWDAGLIPPATTNAPTCQSGGPGAVSAALGCGGSGCRLTCRDGYYPCLRCTDSGALQCLCLASDR